MTGVGLERVLIAMIALQFVHAVEEFVLEFWNAFPPMRAVFGGVPGLGMPVFVAFHASLIGFGIWCYVQVRRGGVVARTAVASWLLIQMVTLVVHAAWFIAAPGYRPGLATTPLFFATIAVAITALRTSRR
jgi:hypothetical protein